MPSIYPEMVKWKQRRYTQFILDLLQQNNNEIFYIDATYQLTSENQIQYVCGEYIQDHMAGWFFQLTAVQDVCLDECPEDKTLYVALVSESLDVKPNQIMFIGGYYFFVFASCVLIESIHGGFGRWIRDWMYNYENVASYKRQFYIADTYVETTYELIQFRKRHEAGGKEVLVDQA